MLSYVDIKKEIGKNIFVYPLHISSIKSNSLDMHASRFAWSLSTKQSTVQGDDIVIFPGDTVLIYTEESIFVSEKIGGSYHSKVTLVSKGLSHISTALDAQYMGSSLIAIHNYSNTEYRMRVGSEFVTLHFWYLNSPIYPQARLHDNDPGHPRMLNGFDDVDTYIEWRDQNQWTTQQASLFRMMRESEEYAQLKKTIDEENDAFGRGILKNRVKKYMLLAIILIAIATVFCIPSYFVDLGKASDVLKDITRYMIFPILVATFTSFVIVDCRDQSR